WEEYGLQEEITHHPPGVGPVVGASDRLPPPLGPCPALLKEPLAEQPHRPVPPRSRGPRSAFRRGRRLLADQEAEPRPVAQEVVGEPHPLVPHPHEVRG